MVKANLQMILWYVLAIIIVIAGSIFINGQVAKQRPNSTIISSYQFNQ